MDNLEQHLLDIEEKLGYTGGTPEDVYDPLAWHLDKIEELIDEGGSSSTNDKHFYELRLRFDNNVESSSEEGTPRQREFGARFYETKEVFFDALSNFLGVTITSVSDLQAVLGNLELPNQLQIARLLVTLNTYNVTGSYVNIYNEGDAEPHVCSVLLNGYLGFGSVCTGANNGTLTALTLEEICNGIGSFTNPSLTVSIAEDGNSMN